MFLVTPISLGSTVIGFLILGSPVDPTGQLHRYLITLLFGGMGTLVIALVGLDPAPSGGGGWIRVHDDGPGIPAEDLHVCSIGSTRSTGRVLRREPTRIPTPDQTAMRAGAAWGYRLCSGLPAPTGATSA